MWFWSKLHQTYNNCIRQMGKCQTWSSTDDWWMWGGGCDELNCCRLLPGLSICGRHTGKFKDVDRDEGGLSRHFPVLNISISPVAVCTCVSFDVRGGVSSALAGTFLILDTAIISSLHVKQIRYLKLSCLISIHC